jgi:hypothetical protein
MLFKFSTDVFEPLGELGVMRVNPAVWLNQGCLFRKYGIDVLFPIDGDLAGKVEDALKGVAEDEARKFLRQEADYVVLSDSAVLVFVNKDPSVGGANDPIDRARVQQTETGLVDCIPVDLRERHSIIEA